MANTFKKFSKDIPCFYKRILDTNPDYIVPVERKGCKLIRLLQSQFQEKSVQIRYKQFFDNTKQDLSGKHIAIIDDASKYTSSLYEYRLYFENLGAKVSTYSFVGQDLLRSGLREKFDKEAKIFRFLNESTYQEYIIQQSIELSKSANSFDIDHLVFQTKIAEDRFKEFLKFITEIGELEYTNDVYTPENISKFCCANFDFQIDNPLKDVSGIYEATLKKIRFSYNHKTQDFYIVPLYYPTWDISSFDAMKEYLSLQNLVLPYELTPSLQEEGMYMNIIYISSLYLLKTFFKRADSFYEFKNLEFNAYDLIAYIGPTRSEEVINSAIEFLSSKEIIKDCEQTMLNVMPVSTKKYPEFNSMMAVMKHLRSEYERLLLTESVLNVKYFLSFDELFSRYSGKASLIKWIDILCDRGVMVTRNVVLDGFFCRACRSGEADYDHIERKANILLPIIINMCGTSVNDKVFRIKATLLNKIIANLAYDYPMDINDFHNFFTKPYYYGPFSYAKNRLNDEIEIPLYDVDKISSFCSFDEKSGEFLAVSYDNLQKELDVFSQTDLVSYSEITTYVDFLFSVSQYFGKADSLNQLIICRDQDIYYRHIHFDIITAYQNLMIAYKTPLDSKAENYLRDAAKVSNEAKKKLKYDQKDLFEKLAMQFGNNLRFRIPYNRIMETKVGFSPSFCEIKSKATFITILEQALTNIMLYKCTFNKKYLKKFITLSKKIDLMNEQTLSLFEELNNLENQKEYSEMYEKNVRNIDKVIDILYDRLCELIKQMPKPRDSDYVLANRKRDMDVAINKAITYIKNKDWSQFAILHFDFSGYRNLEENKAINVIEKVQEYVNFLVNGSEIGRFVYGLMGANSYGTVVFDSIENAIAFAKKLKKTFYEQGIYQIDFKFGCSINKTSELTYDIVKSTWEEAYSCSKFSSAQRNYYAGFVISNKTYSKIKGEIMDDFFKAQNDMNTCYLHSDFEEMDSELIIRYSNETDENVRIGIITALTEEFVSMKKMLINPKTVVFPKGPNIRKSIGREYCIGYLKSLDGRMHKIALTQTIGPGNTAAANRANCLLERFPNLDIIIMTGIAGGIPDPKDKDKHVRLGDIVVASQIIPYDFVSDKANIIELRGRIVPPSARLIEAQIHLEQNAFLGNKPWELYINEIIRQMPKTYSRPLEETDVLYDNNNNIIPHPYDEERHGNPYVFKENIASANRVLKNPYKRDELKKQHNVYAVEMEGHGIADTTWEAEVGYYVIRGISDYCDGKKNDTWHNYAALVAAAYTRALLEKLPF